MSKNKQYEKISRYGCKFIASRFQNPWNNREIKHVSFNSLLMIAINKWNRERKFLFIAHIKRTECNNRKFFSYMWVIFKYYCSDCKQKKRIFRNWERGRVEINWPETVESSPIFAQSHVMRVTCFLFIQSFCKLRSKVVFLNIETINGSLKIDRGYK